MYNVPLTCLCTCNYWFGESRYRIKICCFRWQLIVALQMVVMPLCTYMVKSHVTLTKYLALLIVPEAGTILYHTFSQKSLYLFFDYIKKLQSFCLSLSAVVHIHCKVSNISTDCRRDWVIRIAEFKSFTSPQIEGLRTPIPTMALYVEKMTISYWGWGSCTGISQESWLSKWPACKLLK